MENESATLITETSGVRARGVRFLSLVLWTGSALFAVIAVNAFLAATEHWLVLLERLRAMLRVPVPVAGPDWFLVAGLSVSFLVPVLLIGWLRRRYVQSWRRRLSRVWPDPGQLRRFSKVRRLSPRADERQTAARIGYLSALLDSPEWKPRREQFELQSRDAEGYRKSAAALLLSVEADVRNRAVATGLAVGINRNPWLDLLTIAAAAFEMQLHVLSKLGKKPSLRTWAELWKRTAASLFLNTYLHREESWALKLALQKVALGIEAAGDVSAAAIANLQDLDWDAYLEHMVPNSTVFGLAKIALSSFGLVAGVGATGLKQIGSLIERNGEELLEGILAGGVVYYHGIAIASECLSLDLEHRHSPEMNRTARQAIGNVCASAGQMLRKQVKELRSVLKQSRKQNVPNVGRLATQSAAAVQDAAHSAAHNVWKKVKGAVRSPENESDVN